MAVVLPSNPVMRGQVRRDRAPRSAVPVPSIDQSPAMMLLPTVLSLIAGSCDIISFIGLGGVGTLLAVNAFGAAQRLSLHLHHLMPEIALHYLQSSK